jgi:hypothetical protein
METSTSHRLSFGRRVSSQSQASKAGLPCSKQFKVSLVLHCGQESQVSWFALHASQNSRCWQGLPAPSLVLRCRRAGSFIGSSQVVGCRRQPCAAQAPASVFVRSAAGGLVRGLPCLSWQFLGTFTAVPLRQPTGLTPLSRGRPASGPPLTSNVRALGGLNFEVQHPRIA